MFCLTNLNGFDWHILVKAGLSITSLSLLNKCVQQIVAWVYSLWRSGKLSI